MWEFKPLLWSNWKQLITGGGAHHLYGRMGKLSNWKHILFTEEIPQSRKNHDLSLCHLSQSERPKNTSKISSQFRPLRAGFLENRRECVFFFFPEGGGGLTHLSWSVSTGWSEQHLSSPHYSSNDIFKTPKVVSFQIITTLLMKQSFNKTILESL